MLPKGNPAAYFYKNKHIVEYVRTQNLCFLEYEEDDEEDDEEK